MEIEYGTEENWYGTMRDWYYWWESDIEEYVVVVESSSRTKTPERFKLINMDDNKSIVVYLQPADNVIIDGRSSFLYQSPIKPKVKFRVLVNTQ